MRVVVPFTALSPETAAALDDVPYEAVDVSQSDHAYWDLLSDLWDRREPFAIVEQDIVVNPDTIVGFEACVNDWCIARYPYLAGMYGGLGCVRFREPIMRNVPDAMLRVAEFNYPGHGLKHWCTLDAGLQRLLAARGQRMCHDHQPVGHLHKVPSHGCIPEYV